MSDFYGRLRESSMFVDRPFRSPVVRGDGSSFVQPAEEPRAPSAEDVSWAQFELCFHLFICLLHRLVN